MRSLIVLFLVVLASCSTSPTVDSIRMETLDGIETSINPSENYLTVVYFLSPECPLCINYSFAMKNLERDFASDSLVFYGVFSKEWYSANEVSEFKAKYELHFTALFDSQAKLAQALSATVTPQVFVINQRGGVIYSGKIDNWVNDLGKKKLEVSEHYLENALVSYQNGTTINPSITQPIGCLIE